MQTPSAFLPAAFQTFIGSTHLRGPGEHMAGGLYGDLNWLWTGPRTPSEAKGVTCLPAKQVHVPFPVDECGELSLGYRLSYSYCHRLEEPNRPISVHIPEKPRYSPDPHAH